MRAKKREWICLAAMLGLIVLTRALGLTHEMVNHPDEHVFVQGSASLCGALLDGTEFTETKPYPEGSYFFFLPFQMLAALIGRMSGAEQAVRVWNRAAAVVYYCIGSALGWGILKKYFGGGKSLWMYALLAVFSLIHIEQSRFGTGDAISFALLMGVIDCTAGWIKGGKNARLYVAAVLVGFLGAVKYPLLYFSLVPLAAVLLCRRGKKERAGLIAAGVALVGAGFLALSPGILKDLGYIIDVCRREIKAYMLMGNRTEVGGPVNHIFAMIVYWLGYSDALLAPVCAAVGIKAVLRRKDGEKTPLQAFFGMILPLIAAGFMAYNVFVTALFMRTLYPFFCIALLYAAKGLGEMWGSRRLLAGALIALTVLRGAVFIGAYIPENKAAELDGYIAAAQEIAPDGRMIGLGTNRYVTGHWTELRDKYPQMHLIELESLRTGEYPVLQSGDIVVTGPLEMARAKPYVFPITDGEVQACIDGWARFKEDYAANFVGRTYPGWYAPLFGFWINGVVSEFDFPMNFVYAVP